jgi:hypothetical protein
VEGSIRAIRSKPLASISIFSPASRMSFLAATLDPLLPAASPILLARGLEVIGSAVGDGERKRRGEMVESLRNERADLGRMAEAGVRTSREVMGAG